MGRSHKWDDPDCFLLLINSFLLVFDLVVQNGNFVIQGVEISGNTIRPSYSNPNKQRKKELKENKKVRSLSNCNKSDTKNSVRMIPFSVMQYVFA